MDETALVFACRVRVVWVDVSNFPGEGRSCQMVDDHTHAPRRARAVVDIKDSDVKKVLRFHRGCSAV